MLKHVIVGTAGHIDHGKTQLVEALTGMNADRLKEEQERGITIDIGFAFLTIGSTRFGFVDVPGHERFIKNMLAGVHGIDLVMLVVAADESVMPQTREHFDICRLLNVKTGLVTITKTDLVEEELVDLVEEEVRDFVQDSFLDGAPIVRVSSRTGSGLQDVVSALSGLASNLQEKRVDAVPRLPIDRVFSKRGFGTVVTGTLISGTLKEGQSIDLLPDGGRTSIRGLQVHGEPVATAVAGERTAVNLQGVTVSQVMRGDVVVPAGRFRVTSMLDTRLDLLPSASKPVRTRTRVRFHTGTTEIMARVVLLDRDELAPGQSALVQLRLESPVIALPDDRFIIRRYSPQITIGGGVILDPLAAKHPPHRPSSSRNQSVLESLSVLETGGPMERIHVWAREAGSRGITVGELAARSGLSDGSLDAILADLIRAGRIIEISATTRSLMSSDRFAQVKTVMCTLLEEYHRLQPLVEGMPREELRSRLFRGPKGEFSAALLARLLEEPEFKAARDLVRLASHQVTLSHEEARQQGDLLNSIQTAGYQALTLEELVEKTGIPLAVTRKFVQLFLNRGQIIKLGELLFPASLLEDLKNRIREQKAASETLDVASFKQITGVTRKYAIPLLEYLDRQGITRRIGNDRVIL